MTNARNLTTWDGDDLARLAARPDAPGAVEAVAAEITRRDNERALLRRYAAYVHDWGMLSSSVHVPPDFDTWQASGAPDAGVGQRLADESEA